MDKDILTEAGGGLSAEVIRRALKLDQKDIKTYSPLTLAFIGDDVFDLIVRTAIVTDGNAPVNAMHKRAAGMVKASAQASYMKVIRPLLTEEEEDIYRRGKNAKSHTVAKNATLSDYKKATGFEALLGYLYLTDRMERILELVGTVLSAPTEELNERSE